MANKTSVTKTVQKPVVATVSKEARTEARKAAHRANNDAQRIENIRLRENGMPTFHEAKRAARKLARKGKQDEFDRQRTIKENARLIREAAQEKSKNAIAEKLLKEHKGKTTKAGADRVKASAVTTSKVTASTK